ncbi:hypothetical protein [Verminephrobacter aporrectodeae]|uniref:hypothetical protein n=1 Tax=Verminephrobacter aporrectodeae TaxID=1110389 RepID=UPI002236F1AA|nr:hypothetical protein [Verminephrobacter aporrectodeae]
MIQDVAGNDATSFTDQAVSNLVLDTTAPVLAAPRSTAGCWSCATPMRATWMP